MGEQCRRRLVINAVEMFMAEENIVGRFCETPFYLHHADSGLIFAANGLIPGSV
jgi:hypothetical protein